LQVDIASNWQKADPSLSSVGKSGILAIETYHSAGFRVDLNHVAQTLLSVPLSFSVLPVQTDSKTGAAGGCFRFPNASRFLSSPSTPPMAVQGSLFPVSDLPEGLLYQPDFLGTQEESELLRIFSTLEFHAFDFHGYTARRRVLEFGLEYDFTSRKATPTQNFPEFLAAIRERAAAFAELPPASLVEGMVSEYPPGAPIGWHRDAPQFGTIIGISLASVSRMRFKPYKAERSPSAPGFGVNGQRIISLTLEPRSIYLMRGPARWRFQHSIPPVKELRYSITFRTLRSERKDEAA
jgi:alkylated DNA repair dioxygenase AlkB